MAIYFVSDIHISGPQDSFYFQTIGLVDSIKAGDILVLAGDIFDLCVGSGSYFQQKYSRFFQALQDAGQRGVKIHYIEGNHDFLLGDLFSQIKGLQLHSEKVLLEVEGKRFFVAHGDLADPSDHSYLLLRAFFRSPITRVAVWALPGAWIDRLGSRLSQQSRSSHPLLFEELPAEKKEEVRSAYRRFAEDRFQEGFDFVVMGHCHDSDEWFSQAGHQYINIGFPKHHRQLLRWEAGEPSIQRIAFEYC